MKSSITNKNEKTSEITNISLTYHGLDVIYNRLIQQIDVFNDHENVLRIDFNDSQEIEILIKILQDFSEAIKFRCQYDEETWRRTGFRL